MHEPAASGSGSDPVPPAARVGRRRRRAVGPVGAPATVPVEGWVLTPPEDLSPGEDDDERLRREVPPHHGG